ncbi:riboflavin synthase [Campylobacter mucosalis]|uniref:riboflavin synthase n=1 Tax=Campylobacter mucosalis TaxID=202 RepID=UPI0004D4A4FA|nr:riboflavin synthase [Campylobacter mucosalis]KEA45210.1 riboflavin synthase subunit alpha [Campylobacter mucosalis]QKF63862.1 6,7-dimethyl-8-ribityllumazine synthase (riboflavin synthase, alpha subunit) [Campylobacter mucosalis]
MFNGLIREIASVVSYSQNVLRLKAKFRPKLGDSIAVNGACLSVIELFDDGFSVELSFESRTHIAVENLKDRVHIEPAMRLDERVDGHLVQGHIDAIGEIYKISKRENGTDFYIKLPSEIMPLMANKGSVCVEGVSLTINEVLSDGIRLTIIPITLRESLFCEFKIGRRVNIESDLLARYVARQLGFKKELTWEMAEKFLSLY